jgi:hypothetical protein
MDVAHSSSKGGIARRCTRPIAGGAQNKLYARSRVDHTEPIVPVQNGGSRAPRTWKVMTQRDEGAGLAALPGLGAGLTAVKAACS